MKKYIHSFVFAVCAITVSACASKHDPDVYSGTEASQLSSVTPAVILSVRNVTIKGDKEVGAASGAALGGLGGYMAGGNDELRIAGAAVGALAGGIAGAVVQEKTTSEAAFEYILKKENGQVQTLVQSGKTPFVAGQNVYIVRSREGTRLIPAEVK